MKPFFKTEFVIEKVLHDMGYRSGLSGMGSFRLVFDATLCNLSTILKKEIL